MKKGIIVLLITVLAAGMAFAGLTGSAAINLGYNLDTKDYGFENKTNGTYKFTFSFDKVVVDKSEHQTDIWAEVGAEASAVYSKEKKNFPSVDETDDVQAKLKFKVTKANIHVNDITIGILNAGGAYNYAADYHLDDNGNPILDEVSSVKNGSSNAVPGFTVAYNGYGAGFGFNGNAETGKYNVLAHVQTKSFEFAEGVSAQAAGFAYVTDAVKAFYGAVKASYAADKLSADVAAELQVVDSKLHVEAAANAAYDFVYANVYMYAHDGAKAYLDAQVGAGYTFTGDVEVKVNGYVDAENVIDDARKITVGTDATATVAPVSFFLGGSYEIYGKDLALTTKVTYTDEIITAYAQLKAALKIGADPALTSLKPEVSVSTDKVVENATLALTWKDAEFAEGAAKKANGAITASAKIAF